MYSTIAQTQSNIITHTDAIPIKSLKEIDEIRKLLENENTIVKSKIDEDFNNLFGDQVCGHIMELQKHWNEYGFLDMNKEKLTSAIFKLLKQSISFKPIEDEEEEDEEEDDVVVFSQQ
jgi:hypothetical protein